MSEIITAKAGGTSNRDGEAVRQSMAWAERANIFIASAPGKLPGDGLTSEKATDLLILAREKYVESGYVPACITDILTSRYAAIVSDIGRAALPLRWIDKIATRVEQTATQSMHASSMLGERLMAEIYEAHGFTMLDPSRSPHTLGSDPDAWRGWIQGVYQPDQRYILLGNTTLVNDHLETFSRGGCDTTDGMAAYAIRADLNLNLTDDSALSADPRQITQRERLVRIKHMLYEVGRELGRNGTGLVHPAGMVPLMIANIPTEIRSTFDSKASPTLLDNDYTEASRYAGQVAAVSLMNNVTMHRVHEAGMAEAVGRLAAFETALANSGVALIDSQGDGVDGQKYFIDSSNAEKAHAILQEVTRGSVELGENRSFITLAGYRLERSLFDTISGLEITLGMNDKTWQTEGHDFSTGRHSLRISVEQDEALTVLDKVHYHFLEKL